MKKSLRQGALFVWLALAVALVFYFILDFDASSDEATKEITYSAFLQAADFGQPGLAAEESSNASISVTRSMV